MAALAALYPHLVLNEQAKRLRRLALSCQVEGFSPLSLGEGLGVRE